jgi:transcriptional regulator with XRE-family HTH domain
MKGPKSVYHAWFSKRTKDLRIERNLKQGYVAGKIKMKTKAYSAVEQGWSIPKIFNIKLLCQLHGMTLDEFMEGSPDPSLC